MRGLFWARALVMAASRNTSMAVFSGSPDRTNPNKYIGQPYTLQDFLQEGARVLGANRANIQAFRMQKFAAGVDG